MCRARLSSPVRIADTGPLPRTQQALTKDWLNGCVNVMRQLPKDASENMQILGGSQVTTGANRVKRVSLRQDFSEPLTHTNVPREPVRGAPACSLPPVCGGPTVCPWAGS